MGTMLLSAHFLVYGVDGIGLKSTHLFGRILEAAAELMFVLLLILIAKGNAIYIRLAHKTHPKLQKVSSVTMLIMRGSEITLTTSLKFISGQTTPWVDPRIVTFINLVQNHLK